MADRMRAQYTVLDEEGVAVIKKRDFAQDIQQGLSKESKTIPCKYFYDEEGVDLFCKITETEEYYLTNCEYEILQNHKKDILRTLGKKNFNLVELVAGDGSKTRVLINHFLESNVDVTYIPIDISEDAVKSLIKEFNDREIDVKIDGLVAEYFTCITWIAKHAKETNLVLFLGSNIGNFNESEAELFLHRLRNALNDGDCLLIGFDLKKEVNVLNKAYNDSKDVTAQFNLNLLRRINRELGGDFKPGNFKYYGSFNERSGAVESYLVSKKDQTVNIKSLNKSFKFKKGESIHTENSFKFTEADIFHLANRAGFEILSNYTDSKGYFVDSLWQVVKKR
ncbi:MAG: L-histidine N(alpha)-methyltransferase [Thermoplasmata archaeon]|nr:MAG: L-histidine N(alpha)-methyltransferase [Thermoplasmata archaeon]